MDISTAVWLGLGAAISFWVLGRPGSWLKPGTTPPGIIAGPPTPTSRVYVANGVIVGPQGLRYTITSTDKLWLGRALIGEAGESPSRRHSAAIIWALTQNFALIPSSQGGIPRFQTFTGLVRTYCQPVNPSWAVPGEGKCLQIPTACTPERIARRARIRSLSWASLGSVHGVIDAFVAGSLENPVPGLVDWTAREMPGGQINIEGNVFGIRPGRRLIG